MKKSVSHLLALSAVLCSPAVFSSDRPPTPAEVAQVWNVQFSRLNAVRGAVVLAQTSHSGKSRLGGDIYEEYQASKLNCTPIRKGAYKCSHNMTSRTVVGGKASTDSWFEAERIYQWESGRLVNLRLQQFMDSKLPGFTETVRVAEAKAAREEAYERANGGAKGYSYEEHQKNTYCSSFGTTSMNAWQFGGC